MNATTSLDMVRVWDPLVRLFHWSLAACVFGAFLVEEGEAAHRWLGYTALGLVAFRLAWGAIGSRHARFSDWVRGPRAVMTYVHERRLGRSQRRLGHRGRRLTNDGVGERDGGRLRHFRRHAPWALP